MQVEDVNRLLSQYKQMQKMFKAISGNKGGSKKKMRRMMPPGGFPGMGGMGGGMPGGFPGL